MKVCVICFEFKEENLRRQPWKYIYEISKGFIKESIEVVLITNTESDDISGIKIRTVKNLNSFIGETNEVLDILEYENPDVVIMNLGLTSFLRLNFKINTSVVGVLTSPIYSLKEVLNVGIREYIKHYNHISIHFVGALIPRFLIRKFTNKFDYIVVLSEYNKKKLERIGIKTKVLTILPGIDKFYLDIPDKNKVKNIKMKINPKNLPSVMYFTSPLTLRGTDTLIEAFSKIRSEKNSKLIILSRLEHKELINEENLLLKIAKNKGVYDSLKVISDYLTPKEIKEYICVADIICLPFKIVISDIPLSILEAMAMGKPVVSTNIGCIPEILNKSTVLSKPNNPNDLADKILQLLENKELSKYIGDNNKRYMKNYPNWEKTQKKFLGIILGLKK